jgi:hypothetical protein
MTAQTQASFGRKHIFLALCNARSGEEEAFNRWYDDHHISEVVRFLPGFIAGRRYRVDASQRSRVPWEYVAVYDLFTDDLPAMHQALPSAVGKFTRPQGLDPAHQAWVYSEIGAGAAAPPHPSEAEALLFHFRKPLDGTGAGDEERAIDAEIGRLGLVEHALRYRLHPDQREAQEPQWQELTIYVCGEAERDALRSALPHSTGSLWLIEALRPRVE